MSRYAEIIIDIAYNKLDRPFTYRVPGRMQEVLQPGSLVMVPFGKGNVLRKGYVIALKDDRLCDRSEGRLRHGSRKGEGDRGTSRQ